jgi:Zn-finger nucleic acid-binding protein
VLQYAEMFPICPKCDIQLVALVFKGIEVDMCTQCHGLWLDHGELEDLLERTGARAYGPALEWRDVKATAKGRRHMCPRCDDALREVTSNATPDESLKLDTCRRGHGVWFDRLELRDLLRVFPPDHGAKATIEFLDDMLGGGADR